MSLVHVVLPSAISKKIIGPTTPFVLFFDIQNYRQTLETLKNSFPPHFRHTAAVKANPTLTIMRMADRAGIGFECASLGELKQSLRASSNKSSIVFDSPLKTKDEIKFALENEVNINADNFQELEIICSMVKESKKLEDFYKITGRLGLRINPQVGAGTIATHSTASLTSKFGVGLEDDGVLKNIINFYKKYPFLKMLHVHSGSQGLDLQLLAKGIQKTVNLAKEVNRETKSTQVDTIDIGGGLSVNFTSDEVTPKFEDYEKILRETVPEIFDSSIFRTVITEFGRVIFSKCGWFGSRVEYTKKTGGRHIVLQHIGVDIAIRTVYHPTTWPLRVFIYTPTGQQRTCTPDQLVEQDIAGPCCIAGDIIAHKRPLPLVYPGDIVVVKDVGAYYHSSYSRYNLRQAPPLIGYEVTEGGEVKFETLQMGETVEESLSMFSKY